MAVDVPFDLGLTLLCGQAFRWRPEGELAPLGLPPGLLPLAIASDATLAWSSAQGAPIRGGTWREGADPVPIEGLEGDVLVRAVNAQGVVTGIAGGGELPARAFRWSADAGAVALPTPEGFLHTHGNGIDGSGVVVGLSRGERGDRATRWSLEGAAELLPLADADNTQSVAYGVNDGGWVVGAEYAAPDTFERATAVLWIDGVAYPLDSLIDQPRGARVHAVIAFAVNERGQIAGRGRFGNQVRAIRLDPK